MNSSSKQASGPRVNPRALTATRQYGLTMWGWLTVVLIMVLIALTAMRIAPHYVDYQTIVGILDRLPENEVREMSRGDIREVFQKQFRIESFPLPVKEVVQIERDREQTKVIVDYEIREHLAYNVDVVLNFDAERTFR